MVTLAAGLPVGSGPHELGIAFVSDPMVHDSRGRPLAIAGATLAPRIRRQILSPGLRPLRIVPARGRGRALLVELRLTLLIPPDLARAFRSGRDTMTASAYPCWSVGQSALRPVVKGFPPLVGIGDALEPKHAG